MTVSFKAAAPFHWFGNDYNVGDPVDTSGLDARGLMQLLRGAPVYFSDDGASGPKYLMVVFGSQNAAGPSTAFELDGYTRTAVSIPFMVDPEGSVASLAFEGHGGIDFMVTYAEISVSNLDGTQSAVFGSGAFPAVAGNNVPYWVSNADITGEGSWNYLVGSDLYLSTVNGSAASVNSHAGGLFVAQGVVSAVPA